MGVMHPVGPEEPQTYWARRAAVVVVLALLVALVSWLVISGRGGSQAAPPADNPDTQTTAPDPPATPGDSADPTPSESPAPDPDSSETADPKGSAEPKKDDESKDSDKKESEKKESEKKESEKKDDGPRACAPDSLRTTLTGAKSTKAKQKQSYSLSLINGSKQDCVLALDADHFELKIYSGTDRIWSSADCAKTLKATEKTLKPEQAHEWKMTWNGSRSAAKCAVDDGAIRPGTYVVTAQFKGAKPTQHVFTIKG